MHRKWRVVKMRQMYTGRWKKERKRKEKWVTETDEAGNTCIGSGGGGGGLWKRKWKRRKGRENAIDEYLKVDEEEVEGAVEEREVDYRDA